MIKLAGLYSPNVLITRPPASFLKVTGDQKLRYDLEWPYRFRAIFRNSCSNPQSNAGDFI